MAITIKNMGGGAELTGNASTDNVLFIGKNIL